jgi:hypothetical protein
LDDIYILLQRRKGKTRFQFNNISPVTLRGGVKESSLISSYYPYRLKNKIHAWEKGQFQVKHQSSTINCFNLLASMGEFTHV